MALTSAAYAGSTAFTTATKLDKFIPEIGVTR